MTRTISNLNRSPHWTGNKTDTPWYIQWSLSGQSTENTIPEMGFGTTLLSLGILILSAYSSIYAKVEDYGTENKTHLDIEHWMRNNGGASLQSPVTENWVSWLSSVFRKSPTYTVSSVQTFRARFHFPILRHDDTFLCVWCMCLSCLLVGYGTAKVAPYIQECHICVCVFLTFEPNFMWCTLYPETPCTEITWS